MVMPGLNRNWRAIPSGPAALGCWHPGVSLAEVRSITELVDTALVGQCVSSQVH